MRPGDHDKPERLIREPWWRAAFWEFLLRGSGMLGLVVGAVGGFYLCRLIDDGTGRDAKLLWLWVGLAGLGWIFGTLAASALFRRLRGASGQELVGPSGESGSNITPPPE